MSNVEQDSASAQDFIAQMELRGFEKSAPRARRLISNLSPVYELSPDAVTLSFEPKGFLGKLRAKILIFDPVDGNVYHFSFYAEMGMVLTGWSRQPYQDVMNNINWYGNPPEPSQPASPNALKRGSRLRQLFSATKPSAPAP